MNYRLLEALVCENYHDIDQYQYNYTRPQPTAPAQSRPASNTKKWLKRGAIAAGLLAAAGAYQGVSRRRDLHNTLSKMKKTAEDNPLDDARTVLSKHADDFQRLRGSKTIKKLHAAMTPPPTTTPTIVKTVKKGAKAAKKGAKAAKRGAKVVNKILPAAEPVVAPSELIAGARAKLPGYHKYAWRGALKPFTSVKGFKDTVYRASGLRRLNREM